MLPSSLRIFNLLLNIFARDRKGRSPGHCGAAKGQLETLKLLRKYNADLGLENNKGELPLHDAVRSGRKDLVRWLAQLYTDLINKPNKEGKTAMHLAAACKNHEICSILLEYNADINNVAVGFNDKKSTPLDVALRRGNKNCARYLFSKGGLKFSRLRSYDNTNASVEYPIVNVVKNFKSLENIKIPEETPQVGGNSPKYSVNKTSTDSDTDTEREVQSRTQSRSQSRKKKYFRKVRSSSHGTRGSSRLKYAKSCQPDDPDRSKLILLSPRIIKRY